MPFSVVSVFSDSGTAVVELLSVADSVTVVVELLSLSDSHSAADSSSYSLAAVDSPRAKR